MGSPIARVDVDAFGQMGLDLGQVSGGGVLQAMIARQAVGRPSLPAVDPRQPRHDVTPWWVRRGAA